MWRALPYAERAAIFLRAAELLAGPWRDTLNAATMLGQSKTALPGRDRRGLRADRLPAVQRRTSDASCWRTSRAPRPACGTGSTTGRWRASSYAITPFNFTAIAGNLPTAPALMGNTVVWKPSPDPAVRGALHDAAVRGGRPAARRDQHGHRATARRSVRGGAGRPGPRRHPLHRLDRRRSSTCGGPSAANIDTLPVLPAASSARPAARTSSSPTRAPTSDALHTALVRGAYEYQGQKCSAASRAYVPRSLWEGGLRDRLAATADVADLRRRHRLRATSAAR